MTQEEANRVMNDFSNDLSTLIGEKLAETDITPAQVNEYYGYHDRSQIADMLIEERELQEELKH